MILAIITLSTIAIINIELLPPKLHTHPVMNDIVAEFKQHNTREHTAIREDINNNREDIFDNDLGIEINANYIENLETSISLSLKELNKYIDDKTVETLKTAWDEAYPIDYVYTEHTDDNTGEFSTGPSDIFNKYDSVWKLEQIGGYVFRTEGGQSSSKRNTTTGVQGYSSYKGSGVLDYVGGTDYLRASGSFKRGAQRQRIWIGYDVGGTRIIFEAAQFTHEQQGPTDWEVRMDSKEVRIWRRIG